MDSWTPTDIIDIDAVLRTSTRHVIVQTKSGEKAVFKSPHNPVGTHALVCEFVGTSLARLLDIPTFTLNIFESNTLNILKGERFPNAPGDGVGILIKWESGATWKESPAVFSNIRNPKDITKIVFFDTWVRNKDHYFPDDQVDPNYDNLFFSGNVLAKKDCVVKAIDHTEAFKTFDFWLSDEHFHDDAIKDPAVFGLFPEFRDILDKKTARETIAKLARIPCGNVHKIIDQLPVEWDFDQDKKDALFNFIMQRAEYVADTLFAKLFEPHQNQPPLLAGN